MVAVNPGSNTISMIAIDAIDPCKLSVIGWPVSTMGESPVTAAISLKNNIACVANSGAKAGIAFFRNGLPERPHPVDAESNRLSHQAEHTSNRPLQNCLSRLLQQQWVNSDDNGQGRSRQKQFRLSLHPPNQPRPTCRLRLAHSPNGTAILFGAVVIPHTFNILATDVAFGAATLTIADGSAQVLAQANIPDQVKTCWVAISPYTNTAFVTDLVKNHIVELDPTTEVIKQITDLPNANPGMTDLVATGKFVYALSPGNGTTKPCGGCIRCQSAAGEAGCAPKSSQGLALVLRSWI